MCSRRAARRWWGSLAFALAAGVHPAAAQVNTENLRKRIHAVGSTFLVEGSLTADTGNTQGIAVGGGLGGGWGHEPHLVFAYARVDYSRFNESTSVNKTFAHARYNYEFLPWLWGELYTQQQSDAFQRLALRALVGAGPRVRALHLERPEQIDVYVGTGYMFEHDIIHSVPGTSAADQQVVLVWHRWASYLTLQWQMDARAIVATTLYVQPALNEIGDVRLLSDTLMTFKITTVLNASISASVRYDSEPPLGVLTTDMEVKNSLGVIF